MTDKIKIIKFRTVRCIGYETANNVTRFVLEHHGIDENGKAWLFRSYAVPDIELDLGLEATVDTVAPELGGSKLGLSMPLGGGTWLAVWAKHFSKRNREIMYKAIEMLGEAFDYVEEPKVEATKHSNGTSRFGIQEFVYDPVNGRIDECK